MSPKYAVDEYVLLKFLICFVNDVVKHNLIFKNDVKTYLKKIT